jgi:hypothetical protein
MAYLTRYGALWGAIPQTGGRVFWVAPASSYTVDGRAYDASDGNDGLSPERALRSVARAITLATANVGDVIVLLPGAHTAINDSGTTATSIALNKAGLTLWGLNSGAGNPVRKRVTLEIVANDQIVNVTAADVEIAHIGFVGNASITGSAYVDFSAAASGLYVHDCLFDFTAATASTSILGLDATGAAAQIAVERCYFLSDGAFGAGLDVTATVDALVQDCTFAAQAGTWAAALTVGAATDRCLIRRCDFLDFNGTITAGIDGTGASVADGASIHHCQFGENVTVPIDNFDAGEAQISENYDFGIGATDGGVLITAIT